MANGALPHLFFNSGKMAHAFQTSKFAFLNKQAIQAESPKIQFDLLPKDPWILVPRYRDPIGSLKSEDDSASGGEG